MPILSSHMQAVLDSSAYFLMGMIAYSTCFCELELQYNGCVWKGGRLRLEKAKEHYLVRLKREWEEDAEQNIAPCDALDAEKDPAAPVKAKKFLDKEKHLHIFFPRLKKVSCIKFPEAPCSYSLITRSCSFSISLFSM